MDKEFASQYSRTSEGWIIFPDDVKERKLIFPPEVMRHPAKANLFMIEELVEYLTEPGDTVLDIMSGTGTILIAARMNRSVIAIDIEEVYHKLQVTVKDRLRMVVPNIDELVFLLHGNCKKFLPLMVNAIIFSPPYAAIMKKKKKDNWGGDITGDLYGYTTEEFASYSTTQDNVGQLSRFMYEQEMEKIYRLCLQSIKPDGTMTVIIKDYIEAGQRIMLSERLVRTCIRLGFKVRDWFKREAGGSPFVRIRRARGLPTVDDEDILVFEKGVQSE